MQTIGPYQLVQALGTCPVGGVWSAVDAANNGVTVAVLNTAAAHDPGWRNAFAATANSLAQSGEVPLIAGDYSGSTPWIASAARDGSVLGRVFIALGMEYQVAGAPGEGADPSGSEKQTGLATGSPQVASNSAEPVSGSPQPVSGAPSEATAPMATGASPYQPPATGFPYEPQAGSSPHTVSPFSVPPAEPPRRSKVPLIGVVVLVLAVLVGGGGALAVILWPDSGEPTVQQSPEPTAPAEPTLPPPSQPGIEPPLDGEWPVDWPAFGPDESVNEMEGLVGELPAQAFQVPEGWECPSVEAQGTFAHYTCGPDGDATDIGGDLIIRLCPDPCDLERRDQMRAEIDAWGLRWVHASGPRYLAETTEIDGEERYGLVVTAYYRTRPEGRIDRQLVLRMTAPVERAGEIRKIANSIHDAVT
jgi:hypothetical protein